MKEFLVAAVILVVPIQALTVQVSHHHHAVYLMGGEGTASTTSPSGLFLYDRTGTTTTFKKLCDVPFFMTMPGCVRMDYDNKSILGCTLASSGSSRGERSLLRYHVDSKTWSTVLQLPYSTLAGGGNDFMLPWPPIVDQNGDYLLPVYRSTYERVPTTLSRKHYYVFRVDRNSGMASTLLTSLQLPRVQWAEFSRLTRDIESGKLLIGGTPLPIHDPDVYLSCMGAQSGRRLSFSFRALLERWTELRLGLRSAPSWPERTKRLP